MVTCPGILYYRLYNFVYLIVLYYCFKFCLGY